MRKGETRQETIAIIMIDVAEDYKEIRSFKCQFQKSIRQEVVPKIPINILLPLVNDECQ